MRLAIGLVSFGALVAASVAAQEPAPPPRADGTGSGDNRTLADARERIRKVGPHSYQIGTVTVDAKERTVRFAAAINVEATAAGGEGDGAQGVPAAPDTIELVVCSDKGKSYESLLVTDAAALDLQLALLLLDMSPGKNPAIEYWKDDPDRLKVPGDKALVFIEWQPRPAAGEEDPPKPRRERVEWFLRDVETKKPLEPAEFVFLGSGTIGRQFGAAQEGNLIVLYHDRMAILELAHKRAITVPWSGVDRERCLPFRTPVTVIVQVVKKADGQEGAGKPEPGKLDDPGAKDR